MTVVSEEDQRLKPDFVDAPSQTGPAQHIRCDDRIFAFGKIPSDDLTAQNVDHKVAVQPDRGNGGGQTGDIPAPNLIQPRSTQLWNNSRHLWWWTGPHQWGRACGWSSR